MYSKAFSTACPTAFPSFPPAWAKSGLPPPFPPVTCAATLTMSPAFTLEIRSLVTPATKMAFSLSEPSIITPL